MPSSKGEFYDSLVGREYTISSLMELHGLSRPTVSKWLKLQKIEAIPNSWPPRFTLQTKRNISAEKELPEPKQETEIKQDNTALAAYLNHILDEDTEIDISKMFRKVKSSKDIQNIIKGLEDTIKAAQYYDEFLVKDGLI